MAVVANADRVDVALDTIAQLRAEPMRFGELDRMVVAALIVDLWELVANDALDRGDARMLAVAADEWKHARTGLAFLATAPPP